MGLDPVSMMAITMGLGAAQGILGFGGAAESGREAKRIGRLDAAAARKNAQVEARRVRITGERAASSAIAQFGAAGVILAGSPMLVATDILSEAYLEESLVLERGELEAFSAEARASAKRRAAKRRGIQSLIGGGKTIIGALGPKGGGEDDGKKPGLGFAPGTISGLE